MASGMPSSRATSRPASGTESPSRVNRGSARRARSANSATAGPPASGCSPGPATGSGASRNRASPAMPSGSRLVASTRTSSAAGRNVPQSSATAASTCSQLSSTSNACCLARLASSDSVMDSPGACRTPSAAATAGITSAGSGTVASSTSHTPSANRPATRRATSLASLVLPTPPGPVTVTSRYSCTRSASFASSAARPTRLDRSATNPCRLPCPATAAFPPTTQTITRRSIPTWGYETTMFVVLRYFPAREIVPTGQPPTSHQAHGCWPAVPPANLLPRSGIHDPGAPANRVQVQATGHREGARHDHT